MATWLLLLALILLSAGAFVVVWAACVVGPGADRRNGTE